MAGGHDPRKPLIDNAGLNVFSHCGHWSMIERNRDFTWIVAEFFSG